MKISILTPTHNPRHLKELAESIHTQKHEDWEWIILLNNNAKLPENFKEDTRIKVLECLSSCF